MEIKDSLTNCESKNIKTGTNKDHKIQRLSIKQCEFIDLGKIIPYNFLSLYLDNQKTFPNMDILSVYSPSCITTHGNNNLTIECYLREIKSTNRQINNFISKGGEELQKLKELDTMSYVLRIFQHQHFLIEIFLNDTNSVVKELTGNRNVKLLKCKSFTVFAHSLFLGDSYTKETWIF